MASVKDRFSYIVNHLKKLGAPSEVAIALTCNIRAESGSTFNPQSIEIGSGAPPFIRSGQGYGLFQFSNYPGNQRIYVACRDKNDQKAIEYQVDEMIKQSKSGSWFNSVNYPSYNLSWNEFFYNKRDWSPKELTFAFMRQYERPANQSQDRYTLYQKEIKSLYDWSKYDSNGGSNIDNGDHETYNFDCGGSRITPPKEDGGKEPPKTGYQLPKRVDNGVKELLDHYNNKKAGWKNNVPPPYGPYQCVAMVQHYLKKVDPKFKDGFLPGAYNYGKAFHDGFKANRTTMGLSPKKWQWISKSFKKGDVVFYKPSGVNGGAGHVNVAISSKNALNQNITAPYMGWYQYLVKSTIKGSVGSVYGAIRKISD